MAGALADMVKFAVANVPGVGTIGVGAAATGAQTPAAAGVRDGAIVSYSANDSTGVWEVGRGVYAAGTITRGPLWSSAGQGVAVNLTASAAVWLTPLAEDLAPVLYRPTSFNGSVPFP